MKKILFTSNVSWAMIKFRYKLLIYLIANGYEVYIVSPKDEFVAQLQEMGCHHIDIKLSRKGINPIEDLVLLYNLYKIYRDIKPDIIFNYSIKPIIYGSIAAKLAKIKSIAVNIGLGYTFINTNIITKISHQLYKFALRFPELVCFVNEDDREEFIRRKFIVSVKTLVLPGEGVDSTYFAPREKKSEKIIFLLIARMLEDKGIIEFYKAACIIKKKYPEVEFWLLGSIDLENPKGLEEDILLSWQREGVLKYLGYKKDVREYIAAASSIVLPSYREGKSMTLLEAGSMGKALISTNVEGCKDIVVDGYNGFLCEVKSVKSLADVLEKFILLNDKTKINFGLNSRKHVKDNFDVHIVINIYSDILRRFIS